MRFVVCLFHLGCAAYLPMPRAHDQDVCQSSRRVGAALAALGKPADVADSGDGSGGGGGGGGSMPWLTESQLRALVDRETRAEREQTKQLMADHLRLQEKLDMYQAQLRSLRRDMVRACMLCACGWFPCGNTPWLTGRH